MNHAIVRDAQGHNITVRTVAQGLALISSIQHSTMPKKSNKKYLTDEEMEKEKLKQSTARRMKTAKINAIQRVISRIKDRYHKGKWVEAEFRDVPCGTMFKTTISLNENKQDKIVHGRRVHGTKTSMQGCSEYTLMKSSGLACFILTRGMDQGSLLDLDPKRIVIVRHREKVLASDGTRKARECKDRSGDESGEFDWEGI